MQIVLHRLTILTLNAEMPVRVLILTAMAFPMMEIIAGWRVTTHAREETPQTAMTTAQLLPILIKRIQTLTALAMPVITVGM